MKMSFAPTILKYAKLFATGRMNAGIRAPQTATAWPPRNETATLFEGGEADKLLVGERLHAVSHGFGTGSVRVAVVARSGYAA